MLLALAFACLLSPPDASVVLVKGSTVCGPSAMGSGVVVAPGIVATNAHVVQGSVEVKVHAQGQPYTASAHIIAPELDLCLLKVPALPSPPTEVSPEQPQPGAALLSIGFPGGQGPRTQAGFLKALWAFRGAKLLQCDAPVRPGSSGGGLFDLDGRLIGLTTFVFFQEAGFHVGIPAVWINELLQRGWTTGPSVEACKPREMLLQEFLERMTEEPSNRTAFEAFSRAWVEARPKDPEAWHSLGHILYLRLDETTRQNRTPDPELSLAVTRAYQKALDLNPGHAKAWNNFGAALDAEGRSAEAVKAFRTATQVNPDYALAWLNLGSSLINLRDFEGAATALARGLALSGDDARSWSRLGYSQARLGRYSAAISSYRKATRLRPFHLEGWVDLLEACQRAHNTAAESEAWEALNRLGPERRAEVARQLRKNTGK